MTDVNIQISTGAEYWGDTPSQGDIDELKTIVLSIEPQAIIEIVGGEETNDDNAQQILDAAWQKFCNN